MTWIFHPSFSETCAPVAFSRRTPAAGKISMVSLAATRKGVGGKVWATRGCRHHSSRLTTQDICGVAAAQRFSFSKRRQIGRGTPAQTCPLWQLENPVMTCYQRSARPGCWVAKRSQVFQKAWLRIMGSGVARGAWVIMGMRLSPRVFENMLDIVQTERTWR